MRIAGLGLVIWAMHREFGNLANGIPRGGGRQIAAAVASASKGHKEVKEKGEEETRDDNPPPWSPFGATPKRPQIFRLAFESPTNATTIRLKHGGGCKERDGEGGMKKGAATFVKLPPCPHLGLRQNARQFSNNWLLRTLLVPKECA